MQTLSIADLEGDSKTEFLKYRNGLRIGLTILMIVILAVPIIFITESIQDFNSCARSYECLITSEDYL